MTTDDQIYSYYYAEKDRSLRTTLEISFKSEMVLASPPTPENTASVGFDRILGAEVIERKKTTVARNLLFPVYTLVVGAFLAFLFCIGNLIWIAQLIGAVSSLAVLFWLFAAPRYTETEITGIGILISCQNGNPYLVVPMRPGDAKHAVHTLCEIAKKNAK